MRPNWRNGKSAKALQNSSENSSEAQSTQLVSTELIPAQLMSTQLVSREKSKMPNPCLLYTSPSPRD